MNLARPYGFSLIAIPLIGALCCLGCANTATSGSSDRLEVERELNELGSNLGTRNWDNVQRFFSRGYYGGAGELRDQIEDGWKKEHIIELKYLVNRVLEQDGLLNVQTRWNKLFQDANGKLHKSSGIAEFVLKPEGGSYRILKIGGDRPF